MRNLLALLIALTTISVVFYILIWWGIVEPIMIVAEAIDTDTVTASLVGWEVIKFLLRGALAWLVGTVGFFWAALLKE